ncbi:DUF2691 family protein [Paenibacillus sp. FSL K6-0276]|uniref:DUF2691 family protein n=1 Tax=Paenibacillus sp. FSL K6-0276 TaxID=2921450 RepID=UPI0030ED330A
MRRGITFKIPNEHGKILGDLLKPFNTETFHWYIGGEESYFIQNDTLGEALFHKEIYGMDGRVLKELLESYEYYIIFANFKAFPKEKDVIDVQTYEEFLNSDCQLVLLVVDCEYATVYGKDQVKLEALYHNAIRNGYVDVQYITNENDFRTRLSVS